MITSVQRLMGSTSFSVLATPGTPLVIAAGRARRFHGQVQPDRGGQAWKPRRSASSATIPDAPVVDLVGDGHPAAPRALATAHRRTAATSATSASARSSIGTSTINNSGHVPAAIFEHQFVVARVPGAERDRSYPLVVGAGDSLALTDPLPAGELRREIRAHSPLSATTRRARARRRVRTAPAPRAGPDRSPNAGNFGKVCVGSFRGQAADAAQQRPVHVDRHEHRFVGARVRRAAACSPIRFDDRSRGRRVEFPIRFAADEASARSAATITVTSDDPAGAKTIDVSGQRALRASSPSPARPASAA